MDKPLPLGTETKWGTIAAVGMTGSERYYWMHRGNSIAMIPACDVEADFEPTDVVVLWDDSLKPSLVKKALAEYE